MDNSFIYFTKEEVISKLDIDSRLVDCFKRVMRKMQIYFNANGYTSERNYKDYIEKHFINSGTNNMRIYVDKLDINGLQGFYNPNKNCICIREELLNKSDEELDSTLCHEFIHFLVMHELEYNDSKVSYYTFLNEALTEMLTQQMYPNSNAYDAQVKMHKFINLISNNVNNYSLFLKGGIDASISSSEWKNYLLSTDKFQNDFKEKGYISHKEAVSNENYINSQRCMIKLFLNERSVKTINDYIDVIKKIDNRPVEDDTYINNYIDNLDNLFVNSFKISDSNIKLLLINKLKELRKLIQEDKKYVKGMYEFELGGRKLRINEDLKFIDCDSSGVTKITYNNSPIIIVQVFKPQKVAKEINIDEIDFYEGRKNIQKQINDIKELFSKNINVEINIVKKALEQSGNLLRIERFDLPLLFKNNTIKYSKIYVGVYEDKIVLLDNNEPLNISLDVDYIRFIGTTSKDTSKALIIYDNIGNKDNCPIYSFLTKKNSKYRSQMLYSEDLYSILSEEQIKVIVNNYKNNNNCSIFNNEEEIVDVALSEYAKDNYDNLPDNEKNRYKNEILRNSDKFTISIDNGNVLVGYLDYRNNSATAYTVTSVILYDNSKSAIYNEIYDEINHNSGIEVKDDILPVEIINNSDYIDSNSYNRYM